MRSWCVLIVILMLQGCASHSTTSKQTLDEAWTALRYDADSHWGQACVATIAYGEYRKGLYVQNPGFYPFVQSKAGQVWIGVRGGGLAPMRMESSDPESR